MRIGIGLFVAGALVLLCTLVVLFRSLPRYFRPGNTYTIMFDAAPGVDVGTPVRKMGIRIGEVTSVRLDDEKGEVVVQIAVDPRYMIRADEQPTLVTGVLGGDVTIDFVRPQDPLPTAPPPPAGPRPGTAAPARPRADAAAEPEILPVQFRRVPPEEAQLPPPGPPDRTPVPPGTVLRGVRPPTVGALVNRAAEVVPTTQETMNDIRRSLQRLERMSPLVEETMREYRDLAKDVRANIPELRRTNDEIRELSKAARETIPDLRRTNEDAAATARVWGRLGERLDVLVQANQDKVVKAVDNLNDTLTRANAMLSDENQRAVTATLQSLRSASTSFEPIARNAEDITKEGRTTIRRMNDTLVRADAALADLQQVTRPLAERGERIVRNLDESLDKLNRTLASTNSLLGAVGQSDGTISRLLTDPTLYQRLDDILCNVQRSQPRWDRILRDFEAFADKLARHPELLGVRGAVRPDSGVK
jgi:ABC-type transporter Mla subunit MlaD